MSTPVVCPVVVFRLRRRRRSRRCCVRRFRPRLWLQSTGGAGSFLSLPPRCGIVEDEAVTDLRFRWLCCVSKTWPAGIVRG
jgi:hypothetical protein